MIIEGTAFAIVCNLAFYSQGPHALAYRQEYHRVLNEQACYDLGKRRESSRAWPLYRAGSALLKPEDKR